MLIHANSKASWFEAYSFSWHALNAKADTYANRISEAKLRPIYAYTGKTIGKLHKILRNRTKIFPLRLRQRMLICVSANKHFHFRIWQNVQNCDVGGLPSACSKTSGTFFWDGLMNLKRFFWSVFEVTLHKWYEFKTNGLDSVALKSFPVAKTTPPFVESKLTSSF